MCIVENITLRSKNVHYTSKLVNIRIQFSANYLMKGYYMVCSAAKTLILKSNMQMKGEDGLQRIRIYLFRSLLCSDAC